MAKINKKNKIIKKEIPDNNILDLLGSPNAWTPKVEDIWLNELQKMSAVAIYIRFPPMRKPPNVSRRGRSCVL